MSHQMGHRPETVNSSISTLEIQGVTWETLLQSMCQRSLVVQLIKNFYQDTTTKYLQDCWTTIFDIGKFLFITHEPIKVLLTS
jgi:hypothetical protein